MYLIHVIAQVQFVLLVSSTYASDIFELVHIDLQGPCNISAQHGYRYFLTIVDDHFKATWTFLQLTKMYVFKTLLDLWPMFRHNLLRQVKLLEVTIGLNIILRIFFLSFVLLAQCMTNQERGELVFSIFFSSFSTICSGIKINMPSQTVRLCLGV